MEDLGAELFRRIGYGCDLEPLDRTAFGEQYRKVQPSHHVVLAPTRHVAHVVGDQARVNCV